MKILYESNLDLSLIQRSIKEFGCRAEHNVHYFLNQKANNCENVIFDFGKGKLILGRYNKKLNVWSILPSGILAPEVDTASMLLEFCDYCLSEGRGMEAILEVEEKFFQELKAVLESRREAGLEISGINYVYNWPIIDLSAWDPELKGKAWHRIRNILKNFYRNNNVSLESPRNLPKESLKNIVFEWKAKRKGTDIIEFQEYLNWIDDGFAGLDYASSMCVDDQPCSITAGWRIPNSNSFYLSIILHNYKIKGIGEAMYIESLNHLKRENYDFVNLGGSEKHLLSFKEKFKPKSQYTTYDFSIKKS